MMEVVIVGWGEIIETREVENIETIADLNKALEKLEEEFPLADVKYNGQELVVVVD